jgi:arabinofuranosyltransferase
MFYGDWLPNTYYAKYSSLWPESGVRYAASFVLEYAVWVWVGLLVYVVFRTARSGVWREAWKRQAAADSNGREENSYRDSLTLLVVILTVMAHFFYYTVIIGGDHFEYRVYSHLVILLFVSFAALMNTARFNRRMAIVCFALFVVFSWPVPWIHKNATRHIQSRRETVKMRVPVAGYFPKFLKWYAASFDNLQFWLIDKLVCVRHQEHKVAQQWWTNEVIPPRDTASGSTAAGYPIMAAGGGAGSLAWVLPRMNIIDLYGLNDYVIARNPVAASQDRMMAHDRQAPDGYLECFAPNAQLMPGRRVDIKGRPEPLTAAHIRSCEALWWDRAKGQQR